MHHVRRKSKHCPIMWLPLKAASRCAFSRALKEDLHETVFLVLDEGLTLDLAEVKFVEATEDTEARVEFHFPREVGGHPAIDPQSEKIEFHCRASAKTPRPGRQNALSIRSQFHPRAMRANGAPDL